MEIQLFPKYNRINGDITVSGSKSESNRLLILKQLFPKLLIDNLSNSDDTVVLKNALKDKDNELVDVHHAGTAMRFLTAFFANLDGCVKIIRGSERMHQRPIKILVDALRKLGADISYLGKEGYPPLKIKGKNLSTDAPISISGGVSSQYITALLLIAPSLSNGLCLQIEGVLTSKPYVKMTLALLERLEIKSVFKDKLIQIAPLAKIKETRITVESDWSSASYWYSLIALSDIGATINLSSYSSSSLQGDSCLGLIYERFGVKTCYLENKIQLVKVANTLPVDCILDLQSAPDIAQTIVVTCLGLGVSCSLSGLHTLKIKETDRLESLKIEVEKFGSKLEITSDSLELYPDTLRKDVRVCTYNDHRMAMAFAPLCVRVPLTILDAEVVSKSYPNFWVDLKSVVD